jgi:hypothetical protein
MTKALFGDDPFTVAVSGNTLTFDARVSAKTVIAKMKK